MEMYVIIFITIPIHSFILAKSKCFYKFTLQLCDYKSHSRSLVSSSVFFFLLVMFCSFLGLWFLPQTFQHVGQTNMSSTHIFIVA